MDSYYCVIKCISQSKSSLILYLFSSKYTNKYPVSLTSYSSKAIYQLMDLHDAFLFLSLRHILYLGQELYKAEICVKLGHQYIQD